MTDITEKDIKNVMVGLSDAFDRELYQKTEAELEEYYCFKFNKAEPLESNLYEFYDRLALYHNFCERWEEHHNGSASIVGRVRDKYLMPKIREFCRLVAGREE